MNTQSVLFSPNTPSDTQAPGSSWLPWLGMNAALYALALSWVRAEQVFPALILEPFAASDLFILVARLSFALVIALALYIGFFRRKTRTAVTNRIKLYEELPTLGLFLFLASICIKPHLALLASGVWLSGVLLHLFLVFYLMSPATQEHRSHRHRSEMRKTTAIGCLIGAIASIGLGHTEVAWASTAAAAYLVFNAYRKSDENLPSNEIRPFAVLLLSALSWAWLELQQGIDLAQGLIFLSLLASAHYMTRITQTLAQPFSAMHWHIGLGISLLTLAVLELANRSESPLYLGISLALLALQSLVAFKLLKMSLRTLWRERLLVR